MKGCIQALLFSFLLTSVQGQLLDSFRIQVGILATGASADHQPLWIVSNRFGTVADRKSDFSTNVHLTNYHSLFKKSVDTAKRFYLNYGFDGYINNHFKDVLIGEAYVKAGFKNWQLRAGRFREVTGDVDPELSSGSLGISGNALPIPKVGIIITDYTNVPYTNGWLQFKGQISHGWFSNNRYMKDAFLHEKLFYMRLGKKKFKLHGGVQHFGEWGGRRGNLQLERSFQGFMDVLFVKEVDDGSVGTAVNGLMPNRPGDQRGLLEAGFTWENENLFFRGYNQTPFESGLEIDIRNVDRLIGLTFISKKNRILKKVVGEFITTKDMLSFVPPRGRQSFYNNGAYKTGWEYENRIVGTPLFINRTRGSKYFSSIQPYNWDAPNNSITGNSNIINNRVLGGHFGALFSLFSGLQAKTKITFTRNYGSSNQNIFSPHKDQWYTLQEFSYTSHKGFSFTATIGLDSGELSNNAGFMVGIRKEFKGFEK